MEVKKYKYGNEFGENNVEILQTTTLRYLKMIISRDGYELNLMPLTSKRKKPTIRLQSPRGIKRAESSKGFRTFYEIRCENSLEFYTILEKLGYIKELSFKELVKLLEKKRG
jgi:hypothetical protein